MGGGILGRGLGKAARSGADGQRRCTLATETRLRSSIGGKRGETDVEHRIYLNTYHLGRHLLLVCVPCHSCVLTTRGTVQLFLSIDGKLLRGGSTPSSPPLFHPFLVI
jgi:hypothetical protein